MNTRRGGFGTPVLVDALFLAREAAPAPTPSTMRVVPRFALTPGGGSVGLGGTF